MSLVLFVKFARFGELPVVVAVAVFEALLVGDSRLSLSLSLSFGLLDSASGSH